MSYARWAEDSDVYVFACISGHLECCGCCLDRPMGHFAATSTAEMLAHLEAHRAAGHDVPDRCIDRLKADADENDEWIAASENPESTEEGNRG